MHELSIAEAIVAVAERHLPPDRRATAVAVRIGALRQVVPAALEFAFELVADGSLVAGATLELEVVPVLIECRRCRSETELQDFPLACRACGGVDVKVLRGEELLVDSLELADEPTVVGRR